MLDALTLLISPAKSRADTSAVRRSAGIERERAMLATIMLRISPAKSRADTSAERRSAGVERGRAMLAAVMLRIDPAKSRAASSAAVRRSAGVERGRAMLATVMLRISPAKSRRGTRPRVRRSAGIACRVLTLVNSQRATINEQKRGIGKPRVYCGTNAGPSELPPAAVLGFRDCFSYCDHHSRPKDANLLGA